MKHIIISRTDNLGDVILTLPMAGVIKSYFPDCKITFIGKSYTRPIIGMCRFVDEFIEWDGTIPAADAIIHVFPVKEICKAAKEAHIPLRIATSHRWFPWLYCNRLLYFSRKNSKLHEALLNLKMLAPLGIKGDFSLAEIPELYGMDTSVEISAAKTVQDPGAPVKKFNLILHPRSKGSAREWGTENFSRLIALLPPDLYNISITGTKEEGDSIRDFLNSNKDRVNDLTGKLTLEELIAHIRSCDGIIAASTGPLHIAAAMGKYALGLYAPMRPIWPERWAPIGKHAGYLCSGKKNCRDCIRSSDCLCLKSITPESVYNWLEEAGGRG
ncbi:MAG: glycosyltransferase family 9 protein [Bacteroidetes bacterium]|nr:glycosyltransferase family 9 protein [Bacteroidota bacterium]